MNNSQTTFFPSTPHLHKIYLLNDFLLQINALINWEIFRNAPNKVRKKERRSPAGVTPFDVLSEQAVHGRAEESE